MKTLNTTRLIFAKVGKSGIIENDEIIYGVIRCIIILLALSRHSQKLASGFPADNALW